MAWWPVTPQCIGMPSHGPLSLRRVRTPSEFFLAGLVDQTPSPALKQGLCGTSFLDRSVWVSLSDLVYCVSWWVCGSVDSGCCALRNAGVRRAPDVGLVGPAGSGVIGVGVVVRVWCIVCLVCCVVGKLCRTEKCAGPARGPARLGPACHSGGPELLNHGRFTMFSHACSKVGGCRHDLSQRTGLILWRPLPSPGFLLDRESQEKPRRWRRRPLLLSRRADCA